MRAGLDAKFTATDSESSGQADRSLADARRWVRLVQAGETVPDDLGRVFRRPSGPCWPRCALSSGWTRQPS